MIFPLDQKHLLEHPFLVSSIHCRLPSCMLKRSYINEFADWNVELIINISINFHSCHDTFRATHPLFVTFLTYTCKIIVSVYYGNLSYPTLCRTLICADSFITKTVHTCMHLKKFGKISCLTADPTEWNALMYACCLAGENTQSNQNCSIRNFFLFHGHLWC